MVIVNFSGLDVFLVGELNKAVHSKVAAAYGLDDEDVIFQASDSFIFFKGTEQTSFNLLIKVDAPEEYVDSEEMVASILTMITRLFSTQSIRLI